MNISQLPKAVNPLSMMTSAYRRTDPSETLDPSLPSTLTLYNALTGSQAVTSGYNFATLDALKQYIMSMFGVKPENQFLLTPFGIKFKFQMLIHEETNEIFVFDRKYFNPSMADPESGDEVAMALLRELNKEELVSTMIKPMASPMVDDNLQMVTQDLRSKINTKKKIAITDLKLDNLRILLSSLKRHSGWASALLSDFRAATATHIDTDKDATQEVSNILTSLNVLIQYINLSFKAVENGFNSSIDEFIQTQGDSLHEKWTDDFKRLSQVSFTYHRAGSTRTESIRLADMVDAASLERSAQKAAMLIEALNSLLVELRGKIETEILVPKQELSKVYDYYKIQYLKKATDELQDHTNQEYRDKFAEMEKLVTANFKQDYPSFEELITTASGTSSNLSDDSLIKISQLLDTYDRQMAEVPRIEAVSNELYQTQINKTSARRQLQEKLITSTLTNLVDIQLKMLDANKMLSSEIRSSLNRLKKLELQLSIVSDLPLIFGIWVIASLGNIKHGMSLKKLAHKTNEVIEMMNYMERSSRNKWLKEFTQSIGPEKVDYLNLNEDNRRKFVEDNLFFLKLVDRDQPTKDVDDTPSNDNYLFSLLQNINKLPRRNSSDTIETEKPTTLIDNVRLPDIIQYIGSLRSSGISPSIPDQLEHYLKDVGLEYRMPNQGNDIVVRGDVNGFGSFDSQDQSYMKLVKRFVQSFEIDGIEIQVNPKDSKSQEPSSSSEDLIKGYEHRIKKLENLLHQQTYQQFSDQWSRRQQEAESVAVLPNKLIDLPPSHTGEKTEKLSRENAALKEEIEALKSNTTVEEMQKLSKLTEEAQLEAEMVGKELAAKEAHIKELEIAITTLTQEKARQVAQLEEQQTALKEEIAEKQTEIDLKQRQVNELQRAPEKSKEVDTPTEEPSVQHATESEIIKSLAERAEKLTQRSVDDMTNFCLILESMGLLLIREKDGFAIKRVKGLRGKKKQLLQSETPDATEESPPAEDNAIIEVVTTDALDQVNTASQWLPSPNVDFVDSYQSESESKFAQFEDSIALDSKMLLEKVFRRFNDVETLARRLQKEKTQQKSELKVMSTQLSERLSIRDFKVGDLVLFLKTLNSGNSAEIQPWAVFNIGSPNYYLNNDGSLDLGREWFVGRIKRIDTRTVTEKNYDTSENPLKLSVGITWNYVEAKEDGN